MVFGSKASSSSWEPFCRAIEAMSVVYANRPDLVTKHKQYLDMIQWATIDALVKLTKAIPFSIIKGALDEKGEVRPRPARVFIDDSLLLAISPFLMTVALAAVIEEIFVVMGNPDTAIQQCPLALDKWVEMVVGPAQTMLGLNLDTNNLIVAIPSSYVNDVHNLINTTWHKNPQTIIVI